MYARAITYKALNGDIANLKFNLSTEKYIIIEADSNQGGKWECTITESDLCQYPGFTDLESLSTFLRDTLVNRSIGEVTVDAATSDLSVKVTYQEKYTRTNLQIKLTSEGRGSKELAVYSELSKLREALEMSGTLLPSSLNNAESLHLVDNPELCKRCSKDNAHWLYSPYCYMAGMDSCSRLTALHINCTMPSSYFKEGVGRLPHLIRLNMVTRNDNIGALEWLSGLTKLQELCINSVNVNDFRPFTTLTNLIVLRLVNTCWGDDSIQGLELLTRLKTLRLGGTIAQQGFAPAVERIMQTRGGTYSSKYSAE